MGVTGGLHVRITRRPAAMAANTVSVKGSATQQPLAYREHRGWQQRAADPAFGGNAEGAVCRAATLVGRLF